MWDNMKNNEKLVWYSNNEIYFIIENKIHLDRNDWDTLSVDSSDIRWHRNIQNIYENNIHHRLWIH